ncbi:MAG TPA: cupin domain-containing protein [Thermomicrobiaceae bacterium]|nr:cupin domain-containing protein [Thermomicrobiaceae bacterium]
MTDRTEQLGQSEGVNATAMTGDLIDLAAARLAELSGSGPVLSRETEDLDVNVVRLPAGRSIEEHINREVDVVMVALAGSGLVTVADQEFVLSPQRLLIIPKGSRRSIRSTGDDALVYLSLHRRRARLWPTVKRSTSSNG